MTPRVFRAIGPVVVCLLIGALTAAAVPPPAAGPSRPGAAGPRPRSASILGAAWYADNSPIPHARLRLRNVLTGRLEATAVASEAGRFTFTVVESGSYVVELVSESGKVLTLGHPFTVAPGETVATFVRLGTKGPWLKGFFSNVAAAVAATAASTGVTAIAPGAVRPVSAQR